MVHHSGCDGIRSRLRFQCLDNRSHRRICDEDIARDDDRGLTWWARGGCATLTGADIAEIEQLYARYSQGLDFKDLELFLSAYADDAVFTGLNRHASKDTCASI